MRLPPVVPRPRPRQQGAGPAHSADPRAGHHPGQPAHEPPPDHALDHPGTTGPVNRLLGTHTVNLAAAPSLSYNRAGPGLHRRSSLRVVGCPGSQSAGGGPQHLAGPQPPLMGVHRARHPHCRPTENALVRRHVRVLGSRSEGGDEHGLSTRPMRRQPGSGGRGATRRTGVSGPGRPVQQSFAPFDGSLVGAVPHATSKTWRSAAQRARLAQRHWAARPLAERRAVMLRYHDLLLRPTSTGCSTSRSLRRVRRGSAH